MTTNPKADALRAQAAELHRRADRLETPITQAELGEMSVTDINNARADGRLDHLLGADPNPAA